MSDIGYTSNGIFTPILISLFLATVEHEVWITRKRLEYRFGNILKLSFSVEGV
jgi:hypothetical protein